MADIISIILSAIAIIVSLISFQTSTKLSESANVFSQLQANAEQGALETQLRQEITEATKEVNHYAVMLEEKPDSKVLLKAYLSSEEMYRNAYEDACAKYLDGKIDKARFKKMYGNEVHNLVNDEEQSKFYATNQTVYASTVAVYKEWYGQA